MYRLALLLWAPILAAQDPQSILDAARTALDAGDNPRALQSATQAAGLFRQRNDASGEAQAAAIAGAAQLNRADYAAALRNFTRALELDRARADAHSEISVLGNIANAHFFTGRYLDALGYYEQAIRRLDETASQPWNAERRRLILTNLALLYEQFGQDARALDYYRQALDAARAVPDLPPADLAQIYTSAGLAYRRAGDPAKAVESFDAARRLYRGLNPSPAELRAIENAGVICAMDLHDPARALQLFDEARTRAASLPRESARESAAATNFRAEALFRFGRIDDARREFDDALIAARTISATEEQWTALYGLGRIALGRVTLDAARDAFNAAIANIETLRPTPGNPTLRSEFLGSQRDVYDAAIELAAHAGHPDPDALYTLIEQARARTLAEGLRPPRPTVATLQAALGPASLLVEYWTGPRTIVALWIKRSGAGLITAPFSDTDHAFAQQFATLVRTDGDGWREPVTRLSQLLLVGLPLENVGHLLIVPDGPLAALPFDALVVPGSRQFLVERVAISYLPSASFLMRDHHPLARMMPWSTRLAAFGDPLPAPRSVPGDDQWPRLSAFAPELEAIAHELPGHAEIHAAAADRKSGLFAADLARVPIVHFATYAANDVADANRARILFSAADNNPASAYLFRGELRPLRLPGVDLVVLSASDTTGQGPARPEGIHSLSRAFLASGARSTVTSLWRTGAATAIMERFYANLARGDAKADALRDAKLALLHSPQTAAPRNWAAFILTGDGQIPTRPLFPWWWIGAAAIIVIAGLVIWLDKMKFLLALGLAAATAGLAADPQHSAELIFPLESWHNHSSSVVELPNRDLLVVWFHGSGERTADDVLIRGARWNHTTGKWSEPFLMADTPGFPETNPVLFLDSKQRLFFLWPLIVAHQWETALMKYRISTDYQQPSGPPKWEFQDNIVLIPKDIAKLTKEFAGATAAGEGPLAERAKRLIQHSEDEYFSRMGWFTRTHPQELPSGRILVPMYSDGYSYGIMAISDDHGYTWFASQPIVGAGCIQPSVVRKKDGTLVAYLRDNGPPPKRAHISYSKDDGVSWTQARDTELLNPGTSLEVVKLASGNWIAVYNDLESARHSLVAAVSSDEGATWQWRRHLDGSPENKVNSQYHYPSVIQAKDGMIHVTYSYFVPAGKSIKHARFNEDWIKHGD